VGSSDGYVISIDSWSADTRQKMRGQLKVDVPLGGDLSASIHSEFKEASKRKGIHVEAHVTGGEGLPDFAEFGKVALSKGTDFETIGTLIENLMKKLNRDKSGVGSVTAHSYYNPEFGWDPKKLSLWNDLLERKLQECADRYYAALKTARDLKGAIATTDDQSLRAGLKKYAGYYDT
jgi:hypothetical protein